MDLLCGGMPVHQVERADSAKDVVWQGARLDDPSTLAHGKSDPHKEICYRSLDGAK